MEREVLGRTIEEEKSLNEEVGHQIERRSRPTDSQADVNNLPVAHNNEERGREGATSRRRISIECNVPSHECQELARSRSNSRDLAESPRGMKIDTQPRITLPISNRQDRGATNRGAKGNFYISPRLTFHNLNRHDSVNNIRTSNESVGDDATSLPSIQVNIRSQASQDHLISRSKSRDLTELSRGMKKDIPPRLKCLIPNRQDRVNNNRGEDRKGYEFLNTTSWDKSEEK